MTLTGVTLSLLCLTATGLAEDSELRAWFMNDSNSDRTLPNQLDPRQPVSMEDLEKIGVLYFNIDVDEDGNYKLVLKYLNVIVGLDRRNPWKSNNK